MSRNVTVAIFGNGKTTRSNVEALIGDFKDAVDSLELVLSGSYTGDAGVWILQYAEAQQIPIRECDDPFSYISGITDKSDVKFFLLWDDEDPVCQEAATFAKQHSIHMFDLTDGLIRIAAPTGIVVSELPVQSQVEPKEEPLFKDEPTETPNFGWEFTQKSPAPATATPAPKPAPAPAEPLDIDDEEYEEDEEDDEYDFGFLNSGDLIVTALEEAGRIFASAFVEEMLRMLKQDGNDTAK